MTAKLSAVIYIDSMSKFKLVSDYQPQGDQPEAIKQLTEGILRNDKYQTLLGVTGSGKTFTAANVIEKVSKLQSGTWELKKIL